MVPFADHLAALRQFLSDPRLWGIIIRCALLSGLTFIGLWTGLGAALQWAGERFHFGVWHTLLSWGGWMAGLIVSVVIFPALFGFIGGFFYEAVAKEVDARHRPPLPPALAVPLIASTINSLKFFILLVVLNALALPVYLMLLWVAGTGALLYVIVNGILLGREQFDAVALRRLTPAAAKAWRHSHRLLLTRYGIATAILGLIPFLNLIAPLLGVVAMTRLVNRTLPAQPPSLPR
jgi:uncharacterized protein involved in cysteine biosynthesis